MKIEQHEVVRMALEARLGAFHLDDGATIEALERFANLVAEATKEQLFKELMDMHRAANGQHNYYQYAVIQLRGEPV